MKAERLAFEMMNCLVSRAEKYQMLVSFYLYWLYLFMNTFNTRKTKLTFEM